MRHAEIGCHKFHTGKIPWSPEISAAQELIELWTLVVRRLRGCKVKARTILRKKQKAGYTGETNITESDAKSKLSESYAAYRIVVKDSEDVEICF